MADILPARRVAQAVLIVSSVALLLTACDDRKAGKLPKQTQQAASLTEKVRVLNGDVLVIDGVHVRLAGVWAPQGLPDGRCWAEALASKQATLVLRQMIVAGKSISYVPTGGRDVYNRVYAKVALNGLDLGQTLYDEGLVAKTKGGESFGWCSALTAAPEGAPEIKNVMDIGG
jgi:hypothetical protein